MVTSTVDPSSAPAKLGIPSMFVVFDSIYILFFRSSNPLAFWATHGLKSTHIPVPVGGAFLGSLSRIGFSSPSLLAEVHRDFVSHALAFSATNTQEKHVL